VNIVVATATCQWMHKVITSRTLRVPVVKVDRIRESGKLCFSLRAQTVHPEKKKNKKLLFHGEKGILFKGI
jgi:hypothetical protein